MSALFTSAQIVDLVLLFMLLEGALLWAYRRRSGRGVATAGLLANLAAGGALLLALRAALLASAWQTLAFWLGLALLAHLADLRSRWQA